jgi:hypothetical protein
VAAKKRSGLGPKGTIVRASGKDGPQIVESGGHRWTDAAEEVYLDHLAETCNYALSARRTGFSREAIYQRRRRDPAFAARCHAAIGQGAARIDALLVKGAEDVLEGRAIPPDSPLAGMTVRDAIAILQLHRATLTGEGRVAGGRGPARPLAEVKQSILRKLSAIERARQREGEGGPAKA